MNDTMNKIFVVRDATGFQKIVNTAIYSDKNSMVRIKKMMIPVTFFLEKAQAGCTYIFDENGELRVLKENERYSWKDLKNLDATDLDENEGTLLNSDIEMAQLLTSEDIEYMKNRGMNVLQIHVFDFAVVPFTMVFIGDAPQAIIDALIQNSETFQLKNTFSKEKYIKKKKQKYMKQITCLPVTIMDVCETYIKQDFKRVGGLRFDYLSAMLTAADIQPTRRVLVIDQSSGLLSGAICKRLSGEGSVIRAYGKGLSSFIMSQLDLSLQELSVLQELPLSFLNEISSKNEAEVINALQNNIESLEMSLFGRRIQEEEKLSHARYSSAKNLVEQPVDAILVALSPGCNEVEFSISHVASIATKLSQHFLKPDGRFVFFSLSHTHAFSVQQDLINFKSFLDITFEELFLREFVVLEKRTHPIMKSESRLFSGFLVSAIKIVLDDE
ncbi:tRNA (adenine(58)-N(1))-methyltransferase non-catalytic subunit trm6-like isoform X1 [Hylaeus volcanicus]|uniref:tRNA (adenine(58)-N(1))-methyltransferase non-catalytic subunit trm6-like isoform X1 n=1 Tax=Hylaeus volcanicus TaxID=313075 RepID=UPI0023B7C8A9|nr:tRNA (adenine(58)-N(1))-methyltransferase non-catalytic subunit trm6-like isoform X1 [Hylaeus volcanicus]